MNRDAKIGIVVILLIVCALVIIVGREPKNNAADGERAAGNDGARDPDLAATNLGERPHRAGDGLAERDPVEAVSGDTGMRVVSDVTIDDTDLLGAERRAETTQEEAPVDPPPVPAPAPKKWKYTVAGGDTLIFIARNQLGNERRWTEIAKLNNLAEPFALRIGQNLTMPPKNAGSEAPTTVETVIFEPVVSGNFRKYIVRNGDSLTLIAREQLSDGMLWKKIADINTLAKPYKLEPGQIIRLPK